MRAIRRSISYFKFTCGPKVELFSDLSLVVFLVFLIFYLHVAVCGNEGSDGKFQSSLHLVFKKKWGQVKTNTTLFQSTLVNNKPMLIEIVYLSQLSLV